METKYQECGLCGMPLDESEVQYCIGCEINMLKEILAAEHKEAA